MIWNNKAKKLIIEPVALKGLTNLANERIFKIQIMPEEEIKQVRYSGKHIEVNFK
jgi:hypothetical protein